MKKFISRDFPRFAARSFGITIIAALLATSFGLSQPLAAEAARANTSSGNAPANTDPLVEFLKSLPPPVQQGMSDSLFLYRSARPIAKATDSKRLIFGTADAPTRIVEWTDIRCPHCKHLEEALTEIRRETPPGSWSEEARHFPLDSECNPYIQRPSDGSGVSCLAAKVQICLTGSPEIGRVRAAMFKEQRMLTRDRIWKIAAPTPAQRKKLETCVKSPQTAAILKEDLDYAAQHKLEGTPLVVINNRKAVSAPTMIYTMIMMGGRDDAPGFKVLPPPSAEIQRH